MNYKTLIGIGLVVLAMTSCKQEEEKHVVIIEDIIELIEESLKTGKEIEHEEDMLY